MKLTYHVTESEMEESLLCMDWKREGKSKYINIAVIGVIAAACIAGYALNPDNYLLLITAFMSVMIMFAVLYIPPIRRRKKAKAFAGEDKTYEIKFPQEQIKQSFESRQVFTMKANSKMHCIPKRILSEKQQEEIRNVLKSKAESFFQIIT